MFALFDLFYLFIKTALLSGAYALLVIIISKLLSLKINSNLLNRTVQHLLTLWLFSGFVIFILLFCYSSTHWGDKGLGDAARLPLHYNRQILMTDNSWVFIEPRGQQIEGQHITSFAVTKNYLFATSEHGKFIWDLKKDSVIYTNYPE